MATVFRRKGCATWSAQIRVWDAARGKNVWKQVATGKRTEAEALLYAAELERVSARAAAGVMSRTRAQEAVNAILRLAGAEAAAVPEGVPLRVWAQRWLDERAREIKAKSVAKYEAVWKRFAQARAAQVDRPLTSFVEAEWRAYYDELLSEFSAGTANDHLNFFAMLFAAAEQAGQIERSPLTGIKRRPRAAVEKVAFSRAEQAAILRAARRRGAAGRPWVLLALLGWHTGHRLQDLLGVTAASLEEQAGVGAVLRLRPAKKERQGGREVRLPLPRLVAQRLRAAGDLRALGGGDNYNGRVSVEFVELVREAGIDPLPVPKAKRIVHLKTFHSYRHAMASRLAAHGVPGELARLVTDHESPAVHRRYVHAEVAALAQALRSVRHAASAAARGAQGD